MYAETAWSASGAWPAASSAVLPSYDRPSMPTLPSHHGCAAAQSTVSAPSAPSAQNGSNSPPEEPRPRTSWTSRP